MILQRRSTFDYDTCVFELRLRDPECHNHEEFRSLIRKWYAERKNQNLCACLQTLLVCLPKGRQQYHYQLVCERMCTLCVPDFLDYLGLSLGDDLIEVVMGAPSTELIPGAVERVPPT
jgi:hypothetical protein